MTVQQCIRAWSDINAAHGRDARRYEGRVGMDNGRVVIPNEVRGGKLKRLDAM